MTELLQDIPPNIAIGTFLFLLLLIVVGTMTVRLLRATKREKMLGILRTKSLRKKENMEGILLSTQKRVGKQSNRVDAKPFDLFNPSAINRDLRRAGLPQLWPLVYLSGFVLAFAVGFTILNAPLESFPPYMQSLAIVTPCFYFMRHSVLGTLIESRRLKALRQLILFIESTQRAVSVGASAEDAVAEAIREADEPIRAALMPIKDLLELGYDFIESITLAADRVNLPEFDIFVASLHAQSTTGGSVGEVLKEVVEIARSRLDLQKKVGTLTAEGRFNAFLLGSLPIGLMMYLRSVQADYFDYLWESDFAGPMIFFGTVAGAFIGAFVAVRMSAIKV
jgi:Flp pilus assembly protein TadB